LVSFPRIPGEAYKLCTALWLYSLTCLLQTVINDQINQTHTLGSPVPPDEALAVRDYI